VDVSELRVGTHRVTVEYYALKLLKSAENVKSNSVEFEVRQ
jgi:hypothetical protein